MNDTIFILDDEDQFLEIMKSFLIGSDIPCNVSTFTKPEDLLSQTNIKDVDLFIIDINLKTALDGREVCSEILKINKYAVFLFNSGYDYNYNSFINLDCTFDYIQKPVTHPIIINRTKTLLHLSKELKKINKTKKKIELSLRDIFDYSDIYLLVLNSEMEIRLCSYRLSVDLGFESSDEIIGKNWTKFLPIEMAPLKDLFSPERKKIFNEFTNDIQTKDGKRIPTKWFNTRIKNGEMWTFSIGIPLTKEITKEDSIETMRSYWEDIIKKDRTTINVFKDLM
jgi:DNA-binding response OmpR family regulator